MRAIDTPFESSENALFNDNNVAQSQVPLLWRNQLGRSVDALIFQKHTIPTFKSLMSKSGRASITLNQVLDHYDHLDGARRGVR